MAVFAPRQSAKLSVLEASLEALSEEIKAIPEQLARTGRSSFSAKRIAQLSGRIFLQARHATAATASASATSPTSALALASATTTTSSSSSSSSTS